MLNLNFNEHLLTLVHKQNRVQEWGRWGMGLGIPERFWLVRELSF